MVLAGFVDRASSASEELDSFSSSCRGLVGSKSESADEAYGESVSLGGVLALGMVGCGFWGGRGWKGYHAMSEKCLCVADHFMESWQW